MSLSFSPLLPHLIPEQKWVMLCPSTAEMSFADSVLARLSYWKMSAELAACVCHRQRQSYLPLDETAILNVVFRSSDSDLVTQTLLSPLGLSPTLHQASFPS